MISFIAFRQGGRFLPMASARLPSGQAALPPSRQPPPPRPPSSLKPAFAVHSPLLSFYSPPPRHPSIQSKSLPSLGYGSAQGKASLPLRPLPTSLASDGLGLVSSTSTYGLGWAWGGALEPRAISLTVRPPPQEEPSRSTQQLPKLAVGCFGYSSVSAYREEKQKSSPSPCRKNERKENAICLSPPITMYHNSLPYMKSTNKFLQANEKQQQEQTDALSPDKGGPSSGVRGKGWAVEEEETGEEAARKKAAIQVTLIIIIANTPLSR